MKKTALSTRRAMEWTALCTAVFSLMAHGYRFLNMAFSGDAAQISQAEEIVYQISIGRFLQPVLWHVRGMITAPLTIGLFATAALTLSALMIVSLLGLKDKWSILLVCGILATNETLGVSYATYLPWMDVYMFALLFSTAAVFVSERTPHGWLIAPLLYACSLSLYQSYMQAAVALTLLLLIFRLLGGEKPAAIWLRGIRACLSILAGLLLYAAAYKLVLSAMGIEAYSDYNGLTEVGVISLADIPRLLAETYLYPIRFFLRGADSAFIPPVLTLALLAISLPALLMLSRRLKPFGVVTLLFLMLIFPLGVNFVAFISKGTVHPLMVYSFYFVYVLCIVLHQRAQAKPCKKSFVRGSLRICAFAGAILVSLMLALNIKTANHLYFRRDLEFYATTSAATRILKHAENVEGYVPGKTPVCFLGYLPSSRIDFDRPGFEELSNLQGMRYTYAASYATATPWYYEMILGSPINFVSTDDQYYYDNRSDIDKDWPAFPDEGCYRLVNGTLFIKIN